MKSFYEDQWEYQKHKKHCNQIKDRSAFIAVAYNAISYKTYRFHINWNNPQDQRKYRFSYKHSNFDWRALGDAANVYDQHQQKMACC